MPASKRPRKPMRRDKIVHTNPFNSVIARLDPEHTRNLKLVPHQCLAEIREGRGTEQSWNTLAARINWASVLVCNLDTIAFSDDPKPAMRRALDALRALDARYKERGRYVATGEEVKALGLALSLADDLQDVTTRREHRDALATVMAIAT
jgi:hypothetical protein